MKWWKNKAVEGKEVATVRMRKKGEGETNHLTSLKLFFLNVILPPLSPSPKCLLTFCMHLLSPL
jgi:hypothetical protein